MAGLGSSCLPGSSNRGCCRVLGSYLRVLAMSCLCIVLFHCLSDPDGVLVCQKPFLCSFAGLKTASLLGCSIQNLGKLVDAEMGKISHSQFGHLFENRVLQALE